MQKEEIFKTLISHCCEILPELENHTFVTTDQLRELGANSIDRAEIVTMMLESLSLKIPRVELSGAQNLGELVDILHDKKLQCKG